MSYATARQMMLAVRSRTDRVIVGLSGGKDSLATLDLAVEVFGAHGVVCFFMYLVDGLRCVEAPVMAAVNRYHVRLVKYPHWVLANMIKYAVLRPHVEGCYEWSETKYTDIENAARADTGIEWVATGQRMDESLERRGMLHKVSGFDEKRARLYPLWNWSARDVYSYLRWRRIAPPPAFGKGARGVSGINLAPATLRWVREFYPDDYEKIVEVFPWAGAQLAHEKFYPEVSDAGKG